MSNLKMRRPFGLADVPLRAPGVRVPSIDPSMVYDAPAPPPVLPDPPAVLGDLAGSFESTSKNVYWGSIINQERTVFTSRQFWKGCDVYVKLPDTFNSAITYPPSVMISILVYGITEQGRVLIASGRMVSENPSMFDFQRWVVAARGGAQRFEVTARVDVTGSDSAVPGAATLLDPLVITAICSDELVDAPEAIGENARVTSVGSGIFFNFPVNTSNNPPRLEVVGIQGVNDTSSARYLMLIDTTAGVIVGSPRLVFPIGASAGSGFSSWNVRYRSTRPNVCPALVVSSTPVAYTAVADCGVSITVR
jgi:hypothetical protein